MKRRRWQQWAIVGLAFIACRGSLAEQTEARRRSNVQTEVNHLKAEFKITKTRIQTAQDFEAEVTFTNTSGQPLRLNALFLEIPKVLLKVRRADGTVVSPGPPPFPPADDGVSGRIDLRPGRPVGLFF